MSPRHYVFFDVDHTLIEWTTSWSGAFVAAAREAGVRASQEQVCQTLETAYSTLYGDCVRRHCASGDEDAFWTDYDGHVLRSLGVKQRLRRATRRVAETLKTPDAMRLYREVPEVLCSLAGGNVRLGIITNRPRAQPDLSRLGVAHYFDAMIDAFTAQSAKTEGRMFSMAAHIAAEAGLIGWHVGDSYAEDVQGARAAGLRSVLVDRGGECAEAECLRVDDLRGLAHLLTDYERGEDR